MPDEELTNDSAGQEDSQPEIPDEGTAENGSEAEEVEASQAEDQQEINEPSMADSEAAAEQSEQSEKTEEGQSEEPEAGQAEDQGEGDDPSTTDSETAAETSDEGADQGMALSEEEMAMITDLGGPQSMAMSSGAEEDVSKVAAVEFEQFPKAGEPGESHNIDMLLDVTMPVSIELGRTSMPIQDILNLGPGSVVELNKLAGEPVDLLVNEKLIAKGEVVVVDENFGIRITSMTSKEDRIKSLG